MVFVGEHQELGPPIREFVYSNGRERKLRLTPEPIVLFTQDEEYKDSDYRDLTREKIRTQRTEILCLDNIILDDGPTSQHHVDYLTKRLKGRRQREPIVVAAFMDEHNKVFYYIINGYHRAQSLWSMGVTHLDAAVQYGLRKEEVFDMRVSAAKSDPTILFSRVATWMMESYRETEWARRGLKLSQILNIAMAGSKNSYLVKGISENETQKVADWVREKEEVWDRTVFTIKNIIDIAEDASPELIKRVRSEGGEKRGKGVLNPKRLGGIVKELPEQYALQVAVADVVIEKNIPWEDTQRLARAIALAENETEIYEILRNPEPYILKTEIPIKTRKRETKGQLKVQVKRLRGIIFSLTERLSNYEAVGDIDSELNLISESQSNTLLENGSPPDELDLLGEDSNGTEFQNDDELPPDEQNQFGEQNSPQEEGDEFNDGAATFEGDQQFVGGLQPENVFVRPNPIAEQDAPNEGIVFNFQPDHVISDGNEHQLNEPSILQHFMPDTHLAEDELEHVPPEDDAQPPEDISHIQRFFALAPTQTEPVRNQPQKSSYPVNNSDHLPDYEDLYGKKKRKKKRETEGTHRRTRRTQKTDGVVSSNNSERPHRQKALPPPGVPMNDTSGQKEGWWAHHRRLIPLEKTVMQLLKIDGLTENEIANKLNIKVQRVIEARDSALNKR